MRHAFRARLIHPDFGDPGVYVELGEQPGGVLLDLPPLVPLSNGELVKPQLVCVTHAHMDHLSGFDQLLRARFGREETLLLVGPEGFADNIEGRLRGFVWNLVEGNPFAIEVREVGGEGTVSRTRFRAERRFEREPLEPLAAEPWIVHGEPGWHARACALDHGIVSLGFALEEDERLNVDVDALGRLGLATGPWLSALKQALREGRPGDSAVEATCADGGREYLPLAELASRVLRRAAGERLVYVSDVAPTEANVERIVAFARGADQLYCEAPFLERDLARAQETRHLTTAACGRVGRLAGARRLIPFHFSRRYHPDADSLRAEVGQAFGRPL